MDLFEIKSTVLSSPEFALWSGHQILIRSSASKVLFDFEKPTKQCDRKGRAGQGKTYRQLKTCQ